MKFLSTRTHGVIDYVMAAVLIIIPSMLNLAPGGPAISVPMILGLGMLLYSMLTHYELGLVSAISMRGHLVLDFLGGLVLATSPLLFSFADIVWVPHVVLGVAEIVASLVTQRVPSHGPRTRQTVVPHR